MQIEKPAYVFWLDLVRAVAIVLVIATHAASPAMNAWEDLARSDWNAANVYTALARACVPLLFMVSGYLILNRREGLSSFYLSRFKKVFFPFLVWSVIYLLWQDKYGNYTLINTIKSITISILTSGVYYHFWFMYALFFIYLFAPLFQAFAQSADDKTLWYIGAVFFFSGPVFSFIQEDYIDGMRIFFHPWLYGSYVEYFYYGFLLGRLKNSRNAVLISLAVFALSVSATAQWTASAAIWLGDYDAFYHDYSRLNVVMSSISLFILLKALGSFLAERNAAVVIFIQRIARASFGIYLVHAMILALLRRGAFGFELSALTGSTIYMIPLTTFAALLISWAITAILQKIPYVRAIVP